MIPFEVLRVLMRMPGHFRLCSPTWTKINKGRNVNQSEDAIYCVATTILNLNIVRTSDVI